MRIALDAMGGDYPEEIIKGAVQALNEYEDIEITIVGDDKHVDQELKNYFYDRRRLIVLHTDEEIKMDEKLSPTIAVRTRKYASMNIALELVRIGEADACVSAGNTGALMTASQLKLKRIKGVLRPAITTIMPTKNKDHFILLDVGANAECKPEFLEQFAIMAKEYFKLVLNKSNPLVGLLNIGEEEGKGNELTKETFFLLKNNKNINFYGNIESRDIFLGKADIVVTDGFTGNMVLKTAEGSIGVFKDILKEEIMKSMLFKTSALVLKPVFDNLKKQTDASEYGGALFLGLNGISIKAHGNSNAKSIKNAIAIANKFAKNNLTEKLKLAISKEASENAKK